MESPAVPGLELHRAASDADLEAIIAVRVAGEPDRPPPRIENMQHNLARQEGLVYVLARLAGEPVGSGFVHPWPREHADAQLLVVPEARGRGVGSAILAYIGASARAAGKNKLQGEVRETDRESRAFFERRGYRVVGGEQAVVLDLAGAGAPVPSPPPGIQIVLLQERPELAEGLFPIGLEASEDIPGTQGTLTFELWRWFELDRPTRDPSLFFVALAGDEPVGYAAIERVFGRDAYHGLTAVRRGWRRRGVATALKQAQIAALKERGFRRLVTSNEERNLAMRELNEKLGYRPEPALSSLVIQGPA